MALVVTDLGELPLLRLMLRAVLVSTEDFHLHLYQNDWSPHRASTIVEVEECDFDGYEIVEMTRAGWSTPVGVEGVAVSFWGDGYTEWIASAGEQDVYGYYVTDSDDTVLLWAERFASLIVVSDTVPVVLQPLMRLHSEVEPAPPPPP